MLLPLIVSITPLPLRGCRIFFETVVVRLMFNVDRILMRIKSLVAVELGCERYSTPWGASTQGRLYRCSVGVAVAGACGVGVGAMYVVTGGGVGAGVGLAAGPTVGTVGAWTST